MKVALSYNSSEKEIHALQITGSKSETNRLLILQALFPDIEIENLSESDDSAVLKKALNSHENIIDIHHAGTAMRFLTAYFSIQQRREVLLTGSERMQQRPIGVLVDALRNLGADIEYLGTEGYPPLKITGSSLTKQEVSIQANTSSQYISALMLMAPALPSGLTISLLGEVTSLPYIEMTLSLLKQIGVEGNYSNSKIKILPKHSVQKQRITVESDWSSASYFFSMVALSEDLEITLRSYKKESLQGDAALESLYKNFGVQTEFLKDSHAISLKKDKSWVAMKSIEMDLVKTPDIAQTIAVTCFGLGMGCTLMGLHTLKIKETDRLEALKNELEKLGAAVHITENSLTLEASNHINSGVEIKTYHDHRMALAFAPLALKTNLTILDADVVSKSYPTYWEDLQTLGFSVITK